MITQLLWGGIRLDSRCNNTTQRYLPLLLSSSRSANLLHIWLWAGATAHPRNLPDWYRIWPLSIGTLVLESRLQGQFLTIRIVFALNFHWPALPWVGTCLRWQCPWSVATTERPVKWCRTSEDCHLLPWWWDAFQQGYDSVTLWLRDSVTPWYQQECDVVTLTSMWLRDINRSSPYSAPRGTVIAEIQSWWILTPSPGSLSTHCPSLPSESSFTPSNWSHYYIANDQVVQSQLGSARLTSSPFDPGWHFLIFQKLCQFRSHSRSPIVFR